MRFTFLLLVCCTLVRTLPAQTFLASALAGGSLSQVDGDDLLGFHQPGINAGLRVVAVLGDHWRVGPEILYSQQGAKRNRNNLNISDFSDIRLNTVELPLMVYYKDWRITAEAGAAYQRLIDYRIEDANGADATDQYALRNDLFALQLGVTVYLTRKLGINFRWSRHLTDLQVDDTPRLRGRSVTLRAVYSFGSGETLPSPSGTAPALPST
ncbi:outer membrane protein with beta-barrel domain [Neolewinella xylanilytica]|uniref:Outer membrane protein with beta-barrel domain n=1 Tax=Neolewinella xylanilytica TaxID=1514080 RepID=A0A2S6HZX0_9BACT|nr:outer membrane beta-barrel protein [Neolewinella xylanilytica]PPK84071.1 outer membrane protein with beta-barrel domain [Neolewinella xylanilytica]